MLDNRIEILAPSYRELIKEAFLDAIRTAVVVDDEYPTLDELLTDHPKDQFLTTQDQSLKEKKLSNRHNVREILKFCRSQKPTPWLVDVHDGSTPSPDGEIASVSHLESSDLLILDYHLEGSGGGDKAVNILRKLAGSGHFNLVVVFTKDRDPTGAGIARTINDIAFSLATPSPLFSLNPSKKQNLESKLEVWEDLSPGVSSRLLDAIDDTSFLKALERKSGSWQKVKSILNLHQLNDELSKIPKEVNISEDQIFILLMHKKQLEFSDRLSATSCGDITIGHTNEGTNWVRADTLFITVVSKENHPSIIPEKLLDALVAWDPVPHRLIMSKMRNELSDHGVLAEVDILMNRHLQAGWLSEILEVDPSKRSTSVRQNVARHWESLGGKIETSVLAFSSKIAYYLAENNRQDMFGRFDKFSSYEEKIDVNLQLNIYACSKPVEGYHLMTGQILRIGTNSASCQYWLCLTPACDMEPEQGIKKAWGKRLGKWLPFKAVRLFPANARNALKDATRGYHLFLNENGAPTVYGFVESTVNVNVPTLAWEQFFAQDQGRFQDDHVLEVASIGKGGELQFDKKSAKVVAQLRYEYALNLMNRLGAHLSRVGLDFVNYSDSAV